MQFRAASLVVIAGLQTAQAQPGATAPVVDDGFADHRGWTLEASLGVGFTRVTNVRRDGDTQYSHPDRAGADLAIGGFLTPQLALTARLADVQLHLSDLSSGDMTNGFYGVALQYWPLPALWFGGGIGLALFGAAKRPGCNSDDGRCAVGGWGFDLRAGYTFAKSGRHTANVSLELTPELYTNGGARWTATGFGLLLGYQFL